MVPPKNKGGKMQTIEKNRLDPKLFSELKFQNNVSEFCSIGQHYVLDDQEVQALEYLLNG